MAPQQEKYVTSEGIASVQKTINTDTKPFYAAIHRYVDDTNVDGLGFGLIGMLFLSGAYKQVQEDMRGFMKDADEVLTSWVDGLERIKKVWRAAEDASGPVQVADPRDPGKKYTVPGPVRYR
ncbi:MAG TPA: hypothetical protein VHJ17_10245 [Thermomonospora sp.]|nr:hypothetical protein [Thermomonospora sp.]